MAVVTARIRVTRHFAAGFSFNFLFNPKSKKSENGLSYFGVTQSTINLEGEL